MTRYYYDEEEYTDDAYDQRTDEDHEHPDEYLPIMNNDLNPEDLEFNSNDDRGNTHGHEDYLDEPIVWTKMKIFDQTLDVCSKGMIRKSGGLFYSIFEGINVTGTPYKYVPIEDDKGYIHRILMHEIVWRAFNGEVPDGWEVRHKQWVPMEHGKVYPNDIHLLDIYPKLSTAIQW